MTVVKIYPNADSVVQCEKFPNVGSNYDKCLSNDGDTTFVQAHDVVPSQIDLDLYKIDGSVVPVGATINSVNMSSRMRKDAFPLGKATNGWTAINTYGTTYLGSIRALGNAYSLYSDTWMLNPNSGFAWTRPEVLALLIGHQLRTIDDGVNLALGRSTECYVEIDFTAAVVAAGGKAFIGSGFYFGLP